LRKPAITSSRWAALAWAISLLSGCGSSAPGGAGLSCFPRDAARWVGGSATTRKAVASEGGAATIYVDRSGSMVGYINGATAFDRPLQDLVGSLPATLRSNGVTAGYRAFGLHLTDTLTDGQKLLQTPAFYGCTAADKSSCENSQSHLDAVFAEVAANKDEMAVVISDLWFTNSDIQTSGLTVLQPQLADILASGRAVAIYGIDAPFTGRIFDLPDVSGKDRSIPVKGRHPLFMIVVGSKHQVVRFGEEFARSGSKGLAEGIAAGRIHRSLFTVDPAPEAAPTSEPVERGAHPRLIATKFEPDNGAAVQQFQLLPGLPTKKDAAQPKAPRWTGPSDAAFLPDAVWEGPLSARTRIWFRKDSQCRPTSWAEARELEEGWSDIPGGGKKTLTLDPSRLGARLNRSGVYLIAGELRRNSVLVPNPANAWMRAEWNLAPEDASRVSASPPAFFPTLNLSEVARLMENALATAVERKDAAVVGFSVLVKVEK
jgi:hypothetical protein